jgi:hypothetical protein
MSDTKRARCTLEFKTEAVRLVRGGQAAQLLKAAQWTG